MQIVWNRPSWRPRASRKGFTVRWITAVLHKGDSILKWFVRLLVTSSLVLVACWLGASTAKAQFSYLPSLQNGPSALCRLGLNGALHSYPVNPLRLGWF